MTILELWSLPKPGPVPGRSRAARCGRSPPGVRIPGAVCTQLVGTRPLPFGYQGPCSDRRLLLLVIEAQTRRQTVVVAWADVGASPSHSTEATSRGLEDQHLPQLRTAWVTES